MKQSPQQTTPEDTMTMGNKHTSKRYMAEQATRQIQAFEMLIAGATYEQIAEKVGYSDKSSAHKAVKTALQKRMAERDELADYALTTMLEQLDGILRGHYTRAIEGDHKSADIILKTLDRKAKLLGLDAPTRVDATVVTRSAVDAELETLFAQLTGHAAQQGIEVPDMPALNAALHPPTIDGEELPQ